MTKANVLLTATLFSFGLLFAQPAQAQCRDQIFLDGFEQAQLNNWEVAVEVSLLGDEQPGRSVTLTLNGADPLTITSNGVYCFTTTTPGGQNYSVEIIQQPTQGNVCSLSNNTGTATEPVLVQAVCDTEPTLWDQFDWDQAVWN